MPDEILKGIVTNKPPSLISPNQASDCLNVLHRKGRTRTRYGLKKFGEICSYHINPADDNFYTFVSKDEENWNDFLIICCDQLLGHITHINQYSPEKSRVDYGYKRIGNGEIPPGETFKLTVLSIGADNVPIQVSPADKNGQQNGTTPFERIYDRDTIVSLCAPNKVDDKYFQNWSGINQQSGNWGYVIMTSDKTVIANYSEEQIQELSLDYICNIWSM